MEGKKFLRVKEVQKILDISENKAYNIIHSLNNELEEQGFITVQGRINKQFLYKRLNLNEQN